MCSWYGGVTPSFVLRVNATLSVSSVGAVCYVFALSVVQSVTLSVVQSVSVMSVQSKNRSAVQSVSADSVCGTCI